MISYKDLFEITRHLAYKHGIKIQGYPTTAVFINIPSICAYKELKEALSSVYKKFSLTGIRVKGGYQLIMRVV